MHCSFADNAYNGVALLSRTTGTEVVAALPDDDDVQKRVLAATVDGVRVVCPYAPNGQAVGSEKYRYKLDWLAAATRFLRREFEQHPQIAVIGDFNIAPEDRGRARS
jgi:exodeoxyribonuclease-3